MSTYAVFGMTRAYARQKAQRETATHDKETGRPLSLDEWTAKAAELEEAIYTTKQARLSEMYDAPQFAKEYLELCRSSQESRGLHVRAQVRYEDPTTKKERTRWQDVSLSTIA